MQLTTRCDGLTWYGGIPRVGTPAGTATRGTVAQARRRPPVQEGQLTRQRGVLPCTIPQAADMTSGRDAGARGAAQYYAERRTPMIFRGPPHPYASLSREPREPTTRTTIAIDARCASLTSHRWWRIQ